MKRAARVAYWLLPILFCIWLYWLGVRIWFSKDDFAWLNLRNHVTGFRTFLWAMFHPFAQGTIRPWSERGFFMLFSFFFGLRALPYRLFVLLNQFVNIILLMMVARKLTRSELAGIAAPLLWLANPALLIPMSWTSSYNEIQCTTFFLLGFYLFIRYAETGESKYYWAQWASFILGFGALEINVVYPAILAVYALLFARRLLLSTIPMFGASAVYTVVDRLAAGKVSGGFYYDMNFHPGPLLSTLHQYWKIAVGVPAFVQFWPVSPHRTGAAAILLTAAMLAFAAWQTVKRNYLPLFCLSWFLIILGPLLPLHNHVTDYYLTMPAIGLSILAAQGISAAWRKGWLAGGAVALLPLLYLVPSAHWARKAMVLTFDATDRVRGLVQSVAYAKRIHPNKTILLKGVDDALFWNGVYDSPFRIFGWNDIFVTPESRSQIHDDPNLGVIDGYFLSEAATTHVLASGGAIVYDIEDRKLRNVTRLYGAILDSMPAPALSQTVDVGVPYYDEQLGAGWYGLEDGFRWSMGRAVVYLPGPSASSQKLYVRGRATDVELTAGPLHLDVTVDGQPLPRRTIDRSNAEFEFSYDLPPPLLNKQKIEVAIAVDRITRVPGDERNFGLVFGAFTIR